MGAGISPAGSSPAGYGSISVSAAFSPQSHGYAETGAVSSLKINPGTKDISFDDNGSEEGMGDEGQLVLMLLGNELGSRDIASEEGFSHPAAVSGDYERELYAAVRKALMPAIETNWIELLSVDAMRDDRYPDSVYAVIRWRSVRSDRVETTTKKIAS